MSSHSSLPWSTSVAIAATVNALPVDPVAKIVSASTCGALAQLAHAPAVRERGLAVLDDGDGDARGAGILAQGLDMLDEAGGRIGQRGAGDRRQQRAGSPDAARQDAVCGTSSSPGAGLLRTRASPIVASGTT